jgi:hypothetical protein
MTRLRPEFAIRGDVHAVHSGGQHGGLEPVSDSVAATAGVDAGAPVGRVKRLSLELYALGSRTVVDRTQPDLTRGGFATFLRFAADGELWRVHHPLAGERLRESRGDALYQAVRRTTAYNGIRDYAETGITRRFKLARTRSSNILRLHRTETTTSFPSGPRRREPQLAPQVGVQMRNSPMTKRPSNRLSSAEVSMAFHDELDLLEQAEQNAAAPLIWRSKGSTGGSSFLYRRRRGGSTFGFGA